MMTSDSTSPMSLNRTDVVLSQAEMTTGITTTNRLEELVSAIVIAKPNPSNGGNPSPNPNTSEVVTHWCSLLEALAATSDEACIYHFVDKLNGLSLITDWTHLILRLGSEVIIADDSDGLSDKLIVSLLNLLNRLPSEACVADGGILNMLKELCTSKTLRIKEMASAMYDKWRPAEVGADMACQLTDSAIPENSESLKDEPAKPNSAAKLDLSGSQIEGKTVEEEEEEEEEEKEEKEEEEEQVEEEEERLKNLADPVSAEYSSDSSSLPDMKTLLSPTEEKKKVETVYDDDMDALEIARQVAIQVEEEVVQYRETLYSSPEEETKQDEADLPLIESTEVKADQNAIGVNSIPTLREEESGLTTRTVEEDHPKASKGDGSGLDLNENLFPDHETLPELIHVAASKGVPPSSSIPVSSCRFEASAAAGWTGAAAATSAFRPASPRGGAGTSTADSVGLKRKSSSSLAFEFDLNVAETNTAELILPPSGDSSTEVSSERAKKLKLDLNCINEDEVVEPIPARLPLNQVPSLVVGDHGHSSASSSLRNQAKLDFDLNDDLSYRKDEGQNGNSAKLMGWNLTGGAVPRHQTTPPIFHSFLGPNATSSQFGSFSPADLYHSHMLPSSSYGYQHNLVPQAWYGQPSTSYAVPPPLTPQMVGPASEIGPSIGLSLMSGERGSLPRPGLDLNASTGSVEATNREAVGFRQFFMQSHSGLVQEPVINATSQQAVPMPGTGVRWREQDRERETFSFGFKQII